MEISTTELRLAKYLPGKKNLFLVCKCYVSRALSFKWTDFFYWRTFFDFTGMKCFVYRLQIEENTRALASLSHSFGSTSSLEGCRTPDSASESRRKSEGARKALLNWVSNALPKSVAYLFIQLSLL